MSQSSDAKSAVIPADVGKRQPFTRQLLVGGGIVAALVVVFLTPLGSGVYEWAMTPRLKPEVSSAGMVGRSMTMPAIGSWAQAQGFLSVYVVRWHNNHWLATSGDQTTCITADGELVYVWSITDARPVDLHRLKEDFGITVPAIAARGFHEMALFSVNAFPRATAIEPVIKTCRG